MSTSDIAKKFGGTGPATGPAGAKSKAAMFEQKAAEQKPKPLKKTWKATGHGGGNNREGAYKGKLDLGPPPEKKSITDLP